MGAGMYAVYKIPGTNTYALFVSSYAKYNVNNRKERLQKKEREE